MSAISDFNKVWVQKFPGSELPPAWEEDVKNNLAKHKKRVQELQEELKEEQVYVQFLESLLEEVEKRKTEPSCEGPSETSGSGRAQEKNISDVIKDTLERRSLVGQASFTTENTNAIINDVNSVGIDESVLHSASGTSSEEVSGDGKDVEDLKSGRKSEEEEGSGDENTENANKDHFVTVIEVNGFDKDKSAGASSHGAAKSKTNNNNVDNNSSSSSNSNDEARRLKKVPPRPPPKSFKRTGRELCSALPPPTNSRNSTNTSAATTAPNELDWKTGAEDSGPSTGSSSSSNNNNKRMERPVIFDSRKNSSGSSNGVPSNGNSNSNGGSNSSSSGVHTNVAKNNGNSYNSGVVPPAGGKGYLFQKNQLTRGEGVGKKYEGSKLPLPPTGDHQNSDSLEEKILNPNADKEHSRKLSSVLGAESQNYSHSSSSSNPAQMSQHGGNPNVRSKIMDFVNKMESSHKPMAPNKQIEQLTPKRSNSSFRKQFQGQGPIFQPNPKETIVSDYVDPCDAEFDMVTDQIYDSPPPELDLPPMSMTNANQTNSVEKNKVSKNSTIESRMSNKSGDVGDPDNEPMYDTVAPDQEDDYVLLLEEENQTGSSSNSLSKKDLSLSSGLENTGFISNNDGATIKSQTSVISGHSVTTTTSSGTTSDTDGITGSPLLQDGAADGPRNPSANYVNIDYFLSKSKRKDSRASGESEEDEPALLRAISFDPESEATDNPEGDIPDCNVEIFDIDSGVYGSSVDSGTALVNSPQIAGGLGNRERSGLSDNTPTLSIADQEKYSMFRFMLKNIAKSESAYVEVLNIMLQYMKALKATLATSKPVLSTDDFNIIFYKIPELFTMHQKFLSGLEQNSAKVSVGKHFENLAREIVVYGAFLQNYSRAVDTVRKCGQNNSDFSEITRSIRLRSMNKNQAVSLETLLYSPVSRIQKNVEIIQDLLKCLPESHPDHKSLKCALREFQSFLSDFKMIQPEQLFQGQDRNPRHLVKNSFIVELSEGHRKLRHLFLFNDVLVCAKYKASGRGEKYTFELKWYIPVVDCLVVEESSEPRESAPINLVALRSQASTVRDQIKRQTSRDDPKKAKAEKQRKKLAELEAQLVLASPNLVFKVKAGNGRAYTFFLSSEFERSQWVDAVEALKSSQPSSSSQLSMHELQAWLTSCRKHLKTNMGSYLLRTGRDENLLVGDFYILIGQLKGILRPADLYICLEVDSYGHFFRKAKTKMICESTTPCWNQDFVIELEGAQNLRILLYEDHPRQGTLIRAKTTIELNRTWLTSAMSERKIELQDYSLTVSTRFIPSEMTIRRVPTAKPSGLFGAKITQVCKREKRQVPFILTSCVREVERRGINEVGVYRVSGSASDVSRLKKAFETNSYEAEQLLKEVDIHSVTGTLKLYMRELPEALFTDEFYPRFFEAFNIQDIELKKKSLLQLFSLLPPLNQHIIMFLLDHMVRVNSHENHNKMSLHNMATVFGPTLLRPGARNESGGSLDLLAAGTVDVMAQAGILYFFLTRRHNGEPMQGLP